MKKQIKVSMTISCEGSEYCYAGLSGEHKVGDSVPETLNELESVLVKGLTDRGWMIVNGKLLCPHCYKAEIGSFHAAIEIMRPQKDG